MRKLLLLIKVFDIRCLSSGFILFVFENVMLYRNVSICVFKMHKECLLYSVFLKELLSRF